MFTIWLLSDESIALDLWSKDFQELHLDITKEELVNAVAEHITASLVNENMFLNAYKILTTLLIKSSIFWDITPCVPLKSIDVSEVHVTSILES
jgi:hypothetical protein